MVVNPKNYGETEIFRIGDHEWLRHLTISPRVGNKRVGGLHRLQNWWSNSIHWRYPLVALFYQFPSHHGLITLSHLHSDNSKRRLYTDERDLWACVTHANTFKPQTYLNSMSVRSTDLRAPKTQYPHPWVTKRLFHNVLEMIHTHIHTGI